MYRILSSLLFLWLLSITAFGQNEKKISLAEALKTAVERNLDIQLQRVNIESQSLGFDLTKARFEPVVNATLSTSERENEPRNILEGDSAFTSTSDTLSAQLLKNFDFGFSYSVDFTANTANSGAQSELAGDTYFTQLTFGFEQQLLRGFSLSKEIYKKDQLVASRDISIAEQDLEIQISSIIQQTENAYWDLVYAIEQLKVTKQSLDLAKTLYDQNKIKIEVGTLAPIELVNTEATVANRERDIIDAENRVRAAEDALKKVMNLPFQEWPTHLMPSDQLTVDASSIDETESYELARRYRPELQKTNLESQKSLLEIKYNQNQLKPELKLGGTYRTKGFDANSVSVANQLREAEWYRSIDELYGIDFPEYSLQLSLAWNPLNKQAKINLARARATLKQTELRHQQTEVNIMEEVRSALREIEANLKAIKANEKSVRFQEENLKAEEQKFQNGLSTNYRVSEVQDQLSQSRSTLIQSKVNYLKAMVSYHKAVGNLLSQKQISIQ